MKKLILILLNYCSIITTPINDSSNYYTRKLSIIETRNKIAVIDTGIELTKEIKPYLCLTGNRDFTGEGLEDTHSHGTNIAGIISKYINKKTHCLLILKYYKETDNVDSLTREVGAIKHAIKEKVSYINFSGGGPVYDKEEESLLKYAVNLGIKVVVAAGNNSMNLEKHCNYYPACNSILHKNFYVIGNCNDFKVYYPSSNFNGPVKYCEKGMNVVGFGIVLSGTSQSTAIFTGKLIKNEERNRIQKNK